jgi:hypothetical protein
MRSNTTKVIYFANLMVVERRSNLHGNGRLQTVRLEVLCSPYMERDEIPTNVIKRLENRLHTLGGNKICPLCEREIEGRFYVLSGRMHPTHKIGDKPLAENLTQYYYIFCYTYGRIISS